MITYQYLLAYDWLNTNVSTIIWYNSLTIAREIFLLEICLLCTKRIGLFVADLNPTLQHYGVLAIIKRFTTMILFPWNTWMKEWPFILIPTNMPGCTRKELPWSVMLIKRLCTHIFSDILDNWRISLILLLILVR